MKRAVARLLQRSDFVATGKGTRLNTDGFGLQSRRRPIRDDASRDSAVQNDPVQDIAAPRFGITMTKKTAPRAVDRNRIRRRLREALRLGAALSGAPGHDYVIVGRMSLAAMPFAQLQSALAGALQAVTRRAAAGKPPRERSKHR